MKGTIKSYASFRGTQRIFKIGICLGLAVVCAVVLPGQTEVFGAAGTVTIEKEGVAPTAEELGAARNAYSVELAVVQVEPSVEHMGFRANPVVNASAAVAAYREGDAPPYPFRIFFPKEVRSGKKYPLVLWLHGRGESLSDNECQLAHMQTSIDVLAGPDRPDFYLVAVQCPVETHSWHRPDPRTPHEETPLEMLDKITQALIKGYPIDVDRISILGICTGGEAGFVLIKKFPNRFSALVACSSNKPDDDPKIYRYQPIWLFNNRDDMVSSNDNLRFADMVNDLGGDVHVTVHATGGHNTWTSAQRDDHVIEWLLRQRRGRFAFPRDVPVLDRSETNIFLMFALPIAVFVVSVTLPRKPGKK
ncbi:MAG: hypothetical protein ACOX6D_03820 [Thermoguttaceae bacterium]|jgi:predicted esterase